MSRRWGATWLARLWVQALRFFDAMPPRGRTRRLLDRLQAPQPRMTDERNTVRLRVVRPDERDE